MNNLSIAAAVALALGTASAAQAVGTCDVPDYALYIGGSSAAKSSVSTALNANLFTAGTTSSYSSTNGDFEAFCGAISAAGATATGLTQSSIATVYYRAEGGSVVGALPIASGVALNYLDLHGTVGTVPCLTTQSVTGSSGSNGTTDSWTGCVTTHGTELGITDLEPTVFQATAGNYPTAYSTAIFGTATPAQLATLAGASIPLFQQVFGIFVNTSGINGGNVGQPMNLSKETIAEILSFKYKNWSAVPTAAGGQVSSTSQTIVIKNREAGSGTRTSATLYFLGQECTTQPLALRDPAATSSLDGYATSDVLKQAASTAGSITYASIDNASKQSNLTIVSLSGVVPSNLNAATGQYDYWYEATALLGNTTGTTGGITTAGGSAIASYLTGGILQALGTAPHAADINVIPGRGGNVGVVPLTSSAGTATIYINPFTRGGNSCSPPAEQN
jgi:hypothetical protein